jgi:dUTP pyrophosphatase
MSEFHSAIPLNFHYMTSIDCVVGEGGKLPSKAYPGDAGWDISCAQEEVTVPARGQALVSTGLRVAIPSGYYGQLFSRSGNAAKKGIHVGAGVIDSGYRNEVKVLLVSTSETPVTFKRGEDVAQMVILPVPTTIPFKAVTDLPASARGTNGFGSSDHRPLDHYAADGQARIPDYFSTKTKQT